VLPLATSDPAAQDREEQPRYGAAAISSSGYDASRGGRGGYRGGGRGGFGAFGGDRPHRDAGKALYIGGVRRMTFSLQASGERSAQLNQEVGWQDLKDLFRQAGDIIRADIKTDESGYPTGAGAVVFTTPADAQNAISASALV
jgi:hypothetical protein